MTAKTKKPRRSNRSLVLRDEDYKPFAAMAEEYGVSRPTLFRIALSRLAAAPPSPEECEEHNARIPEPDLSRRETDPTAEEIAEACEAIQSEWSESDRNERLDRRNKRGEGRRDKRTPPRWTVPIVKAPAGH